MAEPGPFPTLRLAMRHPVPLLVRGRGGAFHLSDEAALTEVAVRGVDPDALEEVLLPVVRFLKGVERPSLGQRSFRRFEGRLWTEAIGVSSQLSRMGKAARAGLAPFRLGHGLYDTGRPFRLAIAPHLARLHASFGRETPATVRRATALDLSAEASANLRRLAEEGMVHAGGRLYRAVSPPALFAIGEPRVAVPETEQDMGVGTVHAMHAHYVLPYARLADAGGFADVLEATHAKRLRMHLAVAELARHVEGLATGDDDVDAFANATPSELLDMLRQGDPDEGLAALGEALWPWAARGSIGAVRGADRAEALLSVRRVSEAIRDGHPIARHRNRCALLVRYVDAVARPRLDAARGLPEEDALSLAGLSRGP